MNVLENATTQKLKAIPGKRHLLAVLKLKCTNKTILGYVLLSKMMIFEKIHRDTNFDIQSVSLITGGKLVIKSLVFGHVRMRNNG